MRDAYKFFHKNAGYVVGSRAIGAIALARAESAVESVDYQFVWVDDDADLSWLSPGQAVESVEGCILERRCGSCGQWEHVDSLWGITDASTSYRRVVEAELALEAS